MNQISRWLYFIPLLCANAPSYACVNPPPPLQEANETDAQYRDRTQALTIAYYKEVARKREAQYFARARNVYFARIIASKEIKVGGSPFGRSITVRPLQAIKGKASANVIKLRDRDLTSCGFGGDGPATSGAVSHIIVVFDQVEDPDLGSRPIRYAILASESQTPVLVAAWQEWKRRASFTYDK